MRFVTVDPLDMVNIQSLHLWEQASLTVTQTIDSFFSDLQDCDQGNDAGGCQTLGKCFTRRVASVMRSSQETIVALWSRLILSRREHGFVADGMSRRGNVTTSRGRSPSKRVTTRRRDVYQRPSRDKRWMG